MVFFLVYFVALTYAFYSQDTVAIPPSNFGAPVEDALVAEINKKYANRVLHDIGLCIAVFDLSQAGEGKVRYGDGCLWYTGEFLSSRKKKSLMRLPLVVFRMVVFRPFTSEVIVAKVKSSDEDGIRGKYFPSSFSLPSNNPFFFRLKVSVGFFDNLYIPAQYLPQPSAL